MKTFLILLLLSIFNFQTFAATSCLKLSFNAEDGITESQYLWFKRLLTAVKFPEEIDRCFFENGKHSNVLKTIEELIFEGSKEFIQTPFAREELKKIQETFPLEWSDVDNPLGLYALVNFLKSVPEIKEKMALKKPISRSDIRPFLGDSPFSSIKDAWELNVKFLKLPYLIQNLAFVTTLIKEKDKAIEQYENFQKAGLVKNKKEFYMGLIMACLETECPITLEDMFYQKLGGPFSEFNKVSTSYYLIKYNNFERLKEFKSQNEIFKKNELALIAHLPEGKIQEFYKVVIRAEGPPLIIDKDVLDAKLNNGAMSILLKENLRAANFTDEFYSTYFINKQKAFFAKHKIGSAEFKATRIIFDKEAVYKDKEILNYEPVVFGYDEPKWESNSTVIYDKSKVRYQGSDHCVHDGECYDFDQFIGNWLRFNMDGKKYWVHQSQLSYIKFFDIRFNNTEDNFFDPNLDEIYSSPIGKKISTKGYEAFYSQFRIKKTKWVEGILWLNVDFEESNCAHFKHSNAKTEKLELSNLWIKAMDGDKENFQNQLSKFCISEEGEI